MNAPLRNSSPAPVAKRGRGQPQAVVEHPHGQRLRGEAGHGLRRADLHAQERPAQKLDRRSTCATIALPMVCRLDDGEQWNQN